MNINDYKVFVDLSYEDIERLYIKDCSDFEEVLGMLSKEELKIVVNEEMVGGIGVFERLKDCKDSMWNKLDEVDERFVDIIRKVVTVNEMVERLKKVVEEVNND